MSLKVISFVGARYGFLLLNGLIDTMNLESFVRMSAPSLAQCARRKNVIYFS